MSCKTKFTKGTHKSEKSKKDNKSYKYDTSSEEEFSGSVCIVDKKPNTYLDLCDKHKHKQLNLVSDIEKTALNQNTSFRAPRNVVVFNNKLWVTIELIASELLPTVLVYSKKGELLKNITVTGRPSGSPTGIVQNTTDLFKYPINDPVAQPVTFIACTSDGRIVIYNKNIDPNNTITVYTSSGQLSGFTNITIHKGFLYVADYFNGMIKKFDTDFNLVESFTDTGLTSIKYNPINVYSDGCKLYVTFVSPELGFREATSGIGNGYVDVFTSSTSYERLIDRGSLWDPIGMWKCGDILYVGNFGNGRINKFYASTGQLIGPLLDKFANPITIDHLVSFTGDVKFIEQKTTCEDDKDIKGVKFAFTSNPSDDIHGLLGYIVDACRCDK